jgi:hypothetical protein
MCLVQIFFNPSYQMIFESAFNYLMKQVWCYKFMNVCSWECSCERLNAQVMHFMLFFALKLNSAIPVHHPQYPSYSTLLLQKMCPLIHLSVSVISYFPCPVHLGLFCPPSNCHKLIKVVDVKKAEVVTWGTILEQCKLWCIALDNQLYMGQTHKQPVYIGHLHILSLLAWS